MTTVRFQINRETAGTIISTKEFEALEMAQDGDVKVYRLRPILARFMVDEEGKALTKAQAMRVTDDIPIAELMADVFPAFFRAIQDAAVPKASGNSSSLPSEAQPASEFPGG
jgi:hypothetical protein